MPPPTRINDIFEYLGYDWNYVKPLKVVNRISALKEILAYLPKEKQNPQNVKSAPQTVASLLSVHQNTVKTLVKAAVYDQDLKWAKDSGVKVTTVVGSPLKYFVPETSAKEFGHHINQVQMISLRIAVIEEGLSNKNPKAPATENKSWKVSDFQDADLSIFSSLWGKLSTKRENMQRRSKWITPSSPIRQWTTSHDSKS